MYQSMSSINVLMYLLFRRLRKMSSRYYDLPEKIKPEILVSRFHCLWPNINCPWLNYNGLCTAQLHLVVALVSSVTINNLSTVQGMAQLRYSIPICGLIDDTVNICFDIHVSFFISWNLKETVLNTWMYIYMSTGGQNVDNQRQQLCLDYGLPNEMKTAIGIWLLLEWVNDRTEIAAD